MASRTQTSHTEVIATNGHHGAQSADNQSGDAAGAARAETQPAAAPQVRPEADAAPANAERSVLAVLRRNRKAVMLVALGAVLALGTRLLIYFSSYESTDDAQVDGHLHPVSARINGTILRVNPEVEDNHYVEAGTVLAEIDPADLQAELDRAQADYNRLKAGAAAAASDITVISSGSTGRLDLAGAAVSEADDSMASEKASLQAADARLAQAEANFKRADADRARYQNLLAKHEISQSEYDRVATEAATDREGVIAARAEVAAAQQRVAQAQSRLLQRKADLLAAG
jgi:membrane fusion protein, multidrug efflux system